MHISKRDQSSFTNPEFFYLKGVFGKKFYFLSETVLYEYPSEVYFNAHQDQPSNIYNLIEYTFQPDQKGLSVQPKDPKKSVRGTLMETLEMQNAIDWMNCINHNVRRRDNYYIDIIRQNKKIIFNNYQNLEYNMENIMEQDLKTNQSANQTIQFDQKIKQFKKIDQAWMSKVVDKFIKGMESSNHFKKHSENIQLMKKLLQMQNKNYLVEKDQQLIKELDSIIDLFNIQMMDQFYKKEHIRSLIKSKTYYSNYTFMLYEFISQIQKLIIYEMENNNMKYTRDLLCSQEKLIRNSINDLESVVKTLLDEYNSSYSVALTEDIKHALIKVFKFFQNEIDCFLTYINYFIQEIFKSAYQLNQVNYLLQSLNYQQQIQYIGLGQITIEILELSKNQDKFESEEKSKSVLKKLCNNLLSYQLQIQEKLHNLISNIMPSILE
ncbi:hypothetical protein TTHERM_00372688 (macronuclear) [Tetrahymena thermophila SB210]|uniref:Uncharacterized protein n=1 Tax=Tetrahymena thermophila (strain SB210) TaxID=312017 RepID=A4VEL3_TETTS|nr:hypothetical protein TTHERM_00372688 [Tetrahymena thermophila SB210]EDK31967.1 hypothetical protein TTHERM_00372688 [Tetrahymena thermophila SB210]|eukprot:XP_001470732.1 hypothetical protein TTHERM_00372688 [Tetrahymena thermophila SB210]